MMNDKFFTFDWPTEDLVFIKDYCASLDLKDFAHINQAPDFLTVEECLDVNHSCFKFSDSNVARWGRYYTTATKGKAREEFNEWWERNKELIRKGGEPSLQSYALKKETDLDEKFKTLIVAMVRKNIEEFKDSEDILVWLLHTIFYDTFGFMGWHTNSDSPAWRIYLTYTEEADKSGICFYDEELQKVVKSYDKEGVTCRAFNLKDPPLKHSVFSQTKRWSFGFRVYNLDEGTV